MTSKISIISDAYFQLGKAPINTLNINSNLDMGASNIYDRVIPAVLSTFDYYFARRYASLNKNAVDPEDENYSTSFALPSDFLSLVGFARGEGSFDYKIVGTDIWCNAESLNINYMYEQSENMFPPQFSLYLTYLMCAHLAYQITQNDNLMVYWEKKSNQYYGIAASSISNQEPAKIILNKPLISAFQVESYM